MKTVRWIVSLLALTLLLSGCTFNLQVGTPTAAVTATATPAADPYLTAAMNVIGLLKQKNWVALSAYVDPAKGLRFSPYASVSTASDRLLQPTEVANLGADAASYVWGIFDGSGAPIEGDFAYYYERFVYDADFQHPDMIGIDNEIGKGNTPNNISTIYPGAHFIEYHFTGFDPAYSGMDWKSLRLVFEEIGGVIRLVGIVHAQWTI